METLAYLHAAVAYEAPELNNLDGELGTPWLQSLSWHRVSAQTATSLLAIACSLSIVGVAGNALALQRNDSGTAVVTLQTDLNRAGYYNGTVTGFYGEVTEAAILRFQQENGLTADGVAGPKTLEVLQTKVSQTQSQTATSSTAAVSLQRGDQGPAVVELQTQLKEIGYFDGPITGFYGRLTEASVVRFQQEKQLTADGKVGARTLALLRQAAPTQTPVPVQPASTSAQGGPATPVSPTVDVLSRGDRGDAVVELQNRLRDQGYFDGPATGLYGRLTEAAVSQFQQSRGLSADGKAGPQTLAALVKPVAAQPTAAFAQGGPASPVVEVLQRGDRGAEVTALQNQLQRLGYFDGPITGFFGGMTEESVFRFQRAKGLGIDGKVGPNTVTALEKAVAPSPSKPAAQGETAAAPGSNTLFERGDRGVQVADLQNRLRNAGYFDGPMTGFYGRLTEDAVTKFQQEKGLTVDGKVGPKTLTALRQLPRPQAGDRPTQASAPRPTTNGQAPAARPSTQASASPTSAPRAAVSPSPQASASSPTAAASPRASVSPSPQVSASPTAAAPQASVSPSPQASASTPAPQAQSLSVPPASPRPTASAQAPQASPTNIANQPLKVGDSGVAVAELQAALKRAGYLQGQVTGFFGKLTEDAVIKFQRAKGLTADGVAGTRTQEALRRAVDP